MDARQIYDDVVSLTSDASEPTTSPLAAGKLNCPAVNLPPGGAITLADGQVVELAGPAIFRPTCTFASPPAIIANGGGGTISVEEVDGAAVSGDSHISDFQDPFYASTFPQCYALAATTIVAYTLVIMLVITPRSFLDGGVVVLGRKGFTNGGTGTNIGGRPWLQKVAALTVAISLTVATAATFRVAEEQYHSGYQNAGQMQEAVLGGLEIKIIRIISDTFLWLAQAQTLIRLFPRQREKVIIKWTAFALISLDVIFQSLNSFQYIGQGAIRPRSFTDAIPALSYLFALSLGVLYAAWVIYYSLMKKRYAFYHPQMKNICLVAALSMLAILVPVVFFILDISKPEFTGWGDYVRWVGAAAASVIVWEWVERIEALEREEKKDGILGREVFDGDEMLEATLSDISWSRRRRKGPDDGDGESGRKGGRDDGASTGRSHLWPSMTSIASRYRSRPGQNRMDPPKELSTVQPTNHDRIRFLQPPLWPARPAPAVTPISRTDTASAASTIYAVRYHPLTETTSRTTPPLSHDNDIHLVRTDSNVSHNRRDDGVSSPVSEAPGTTPGAVRHHDPSDLSSRSRWRSFARSIPIPRVGRDIHDEEKPPVATIITAGNIENMSVASKEKAAQRDDSGGGGGRWDIKGRLEEFAVVQAERIRERIRPTPDTDSLPVTVIPAPPRRGAALAQLREEEELELQQQESTVLPRRSSGGAASRDLHAVDDDASPVSPHQHHRASYSAGSGAFGSPTGEPSSSLPFSSTPRRSTRTLPVTIIPAPPRRDSTGVSSPTAPAHQPRGGVSPGIGPGSPSL